MLRANCVAAARERARLHFRTHNGTLKALVRVHLATVEPSFLNIDVKVHNGLIPVPILRCFRGKLKLRTDNGTAVRLSPALAPRAGTLSALNETHTYFVCERHGRGMWHTGESEGGEEVDGLFGSSNNGDVMISYDDEDASSTGVLSSPIKAF